MASKMDWRMGAPAIGFGVALFLMPPAVGTSVVVERPWMSLTVLLYCVGALLTTAERFLPSIGNVAYSHRYAALSSEDELELRPPSPTLREIVNNFRREKEEQQQQQQEQPAAVTRTLPILVAGICLRVGLWSQVAENTQCAWSSLYPLIPFCLSLYDFFKVQRKAKMTVIELHMGSTVLSNWRILLQTRYRFVIACTLISWSSLAIGRTTSAPTLNYICSPDSFTAFLTPLWQCAAFVIDVGLGIYVTTLVAQNRSGKLRSIGSSSIVSALILTLFAMASSILLGSLRWINVSRWFMWILIKAIVLVTLAVFCSLQLVGNFGIVKLAAIAICLLSYSIGLTSIWNHSSSFPVVSSGSVIFSICILLLSLAAYFIAEGSSLQPPISGTDPSSLSLYRRKITIFVAAALLPISTSFIRSSSISFHPVDALMYLAGEEQAEWNLNAVFGASASTAALAYRIGFDRNPPPRFDIWHEYASNSSSLVVNDFDGINDDILLFWSLSPEDLRQRTDAMINELDNNIGGIRVRNGSTIVVAEDDQQEEYLARVQAMMQPFAQWLPDLDIAINTAPESRVIVPHAEVTRRRIAAEEAITSPESGHDFSENRAATWQNGALSEEAVFETPSSSRSFLDLGATACPSEAAAWTADSDLQGLCLSCVRPHSLGQFLSDMDLSTSPCHQPDLAHLHGFYQTSEKRTITNDLMPVFSVRKVWGYQDLLFPSPTDHENAPREDELTGYRSNNNVWHDEEEEEDSEGPWCDEKRANTTVTPKTRSNDTLSRTRWTGRRWMNSYNGTDSTSNSTWSTTLSKSAYCKTERQMFWRGSLSEGPSTHGSWQGLTPQRLAYQGYESPQTQTMLVHKSGWLTPWWTEKLQYTKLSASILNDAIPTDMQPTARKSGCTGDDCAAQSGVFTEAAPSTLDEHRKHRYLLALDDADSRGNFLDFLRSDSLPFRASIFRNWYDKRLKPWVHYVPIDIRLHGLWASLGYFSGVDVDGHKWEEHDREGEMIANEGRDWARKVLRKEDMELYFFMLLLEWARVTDDARDSIGYVATLGIESSRRSTTT